MKGLIFDPFAGISGDMLLGALVDLGLEAGWLRELVASLGVPGEVVVERADRSGISCGRVRFDLPHEHVHRHLPDVLEIIEGAALPAAVRERAARVFRRLAEAEADVHGVAVERVHFHEVGALDSILDVVGGVGGLHELGYEQFFTRPVAVGSGAVEIAHGRFPLPAPATARLLNGLPVRETGLPEEQTTPTGAALLAELTGGARAPAEVIYGSSGFGAGTRNPDGRPNCLRLIECEVREPAGPAVYLVQADVDDLAPEYVAAAREDLTEAGALDVVVTRIDMKKERPGVRLDVLVPEPSLSRVVEAMFVATPTIGVRYWRTERAILERTEEVVEWEGQRVRVKRVRLPNGRTRTKPEYEDVVRAARATGRAAHEVRTELDRLDRGPTGSID